MSRASRRRAERERKKREKKPKSQSRGLGNQDMPTIPCVPWNEESPKCPECASDWIDEGDRYSCHVCGRFIKKMDIEVHDCERCGRQFLYDDLEIWTDSDDLEDHELCSDCLSAVMYRGDLVWFKKS